MRCLRYSCLFLFAAFNSPGQDLKEFEKKITEFTLPNGLHFILLERHEAPVVSFHTFVNAGSADDPSRQTGLARMMERMAFKGTESIGTLSWPSEKKALDAVEEAYDRVEAEVNKGIKADPSRIDMLRNQAHLAADSAQRSQQPNEYLRILEENGATNRIATASYDYTRVAYSLPSNRIELWFLMESQRLLHPVFRDFYKERDDVLEEARQQSESNAQGKLFGEFLAAAFKAHPYRNPPTGWPGDIQNLRSGAAREFFDRYYVPGNISIAIAGDVNPAEARRLAERYFGPMASKPMPPALHTEEPPQEGPKTVVVEASGPPLLAIGYKRPSQYDKDDLDFDIIQFLLAQGNAGILYQDLVQNKRVAAQARVGATFPSGRYPPLMIFMIVPAPGHSIEENQRAFDDLLLRFKSTLMDQAALDRAKAQVRAIFMRRVAANDDVAGLLAEYHAQFGDWRKMLASIDDLPKVTADTVQRAAGKYLVATGRTTAYTVAPGEADRLPVAPRPQPADRKTGGLP